MNWQEALHNIPAKGYRKTKAGYEAFVSDRCRTVNLGTHKRKCDAEDAVMRYRVTRLLRSIEEYDLDINDCKVFLDKYIVFPEGFIFNLHGMLIRACVDRNGYIHGILDGRNYQWHRIIAELFCEREIGKDYVNHIDGNKQNNAAWNLEWVTRSENTKHSYRLMLQKSTGTGDVYTQEKRDYIRDHCYDDYKNVADYLGKSRETVRKYMARSRKEKNND